MDTFFKKIDACIDQGIEFLWKSQTSNGMYVCYFSNNKQIEAHDEPIKGWYHNDSVIFPSILIANSLLTLAADNRVDRMINKVTNFLMEQKRPENVWNHFTYYHWLYSICPFDIDDTALASVLLNARGISFKSNKKLVASHKNRKGLFYSFFSLRPNVILNWQYWRVALTELKHPIKSFLFWKNAEGSRYVIDTVVNANVLFYLGETNDTKAIVPLLNKTIADAKEDDCDTWYRNPLSVYYFISRNYFNGTQSLEPSRLPVIERIKARQLADGSIGETAVDTALAICSLIYFKYTGPEIKRAVDALVAAQLENGSWKRCIFYTGGPLLRVGWGSEELNTGFCLEALARYRQLA